jgi:hypothetical protein
MDLRTFEGARQFQRAKIEPGSRHVKAGLYVFGANHGQFNTVWGRNDNAFPYMALFNKRELLRAEEQEKIGKVFISAFLEATLNGQTGYFPLFRDYRAGLSWLPQTVYLSQYEDPGCVFICTFEEDLNVTSTTLEGGEIRSENLTVWKEGAVPLKWGRQATRAVYAGWNGTPKDSLPGVLIIRHPRAFPVRADSLTYLYFVMADARENPNPYPAKDEGEDPVTETEKRMMENPGPAEDKDKNKSEDKKEPIDLSIVIIDAAGNQSALPLSSYSFLSRQLEPKLMKADFMTDIDGSDLVFQVFFYPLSSFRDINDTLDIGHIREIQFVFDRTEEGVVVIDNIGFWKDPLNAAI